MASDIWPIPAILTLVAFSVASAGLAQADDALLRGFHSPPAEARPLVFWQWMNGCVTKEGIVSDLDSFRRVGIAGVQQFLVGGSEATVTDPTVQVMNPKWRELMQFAEGEAARRGLTFGTHDCPGWSATGGPWVQPDDAMQKLVWSSADVEGPKEIALTIASPEVDPRWHYYHDVAVLAVSREADATPVGKVIDLTAALDADGRLHWNAPAGKWRILRFGRTLTGKINGTAPLSGQGLEVDKMNRQALDRFYSAYPARLIADAGSLAGTTFQRIETDSYEAGMQDWTPDMAGEFLRRRGYDVRPWLPALAGVTVESAEQTARFREDWTRTIEELFATNYFGHLAELIHRTPGMNYLMEPYATGHEEPFDTTAVSATGDILMCEFWEKPSTWGWDSVRPVASAAHTWGKRVVAAESFTGQPQYAWRVAPFDLKTTGDRAFASGVNRLVLHAAAHQPWPQLKPGMTMGWWGTHFGSGQTWWEHGGPEWIAYLSRCQFLLQQGKFAADICFLGRGRDRPAIPLGYDGDVIGERALLERLQVRDGRLTLPDGMSYRILVLPAETHLPLEVARKIRQLVREGAIVVGPRPERVTGRQGLPNSDREIAAIAAELWGNGAGALDTGRTVGRGRVFSAVPPEKVLRQLEVQPDVDAGKSGSDVVWIHRKADDAEFYFVANQRETPLTAELVLRSASQVVEIWHPDSGEIEPATATPTAGGRTRVHIEFTPAGSCFVVFRANPTADASPSARFVAAAEKPIAVAGPWELTFPPGYGAPPRVTLDSLQSWTENAVPGVRYFSGTATYHAQFNLAPADVTAAGKLMLDLGRVEKIAAVRVNGVRFPALWAPPFRVDIAPAARVGANELEVEVTNLWPNRLIGDEHEPDDAKWGKAEVFGFVKPVPTIGRRLLEVPDWVTHHLPRPSTGRVTFTTYKFFTADDALLPSGLLGPVKIERLVPAQVPPADTRQR